MRAPASYVYPAYVYPDREAAYAEHGYTYMSWTTMDGCFPWVSTRVRAALCEDTGRKDSNGYRLFKVVGGLRKFREDAELEAAALLVGSTVE